MSNGSSGRVVRSGFAAARKAILLAALGTPGLVEQIAWGAPTRDATAAEALFAEGRRLMAAKDYAAACPKFAESEALDPAAGTALNLAVCYEKLGKLASAWSAYKTAEAGARWAGQQQRSSLADKAAARLSPTLSRLTIAVPAAAAIPGLEVRIDGQPVGSAEWGVSVPRDGGRHELEASAPGKRPWTAHVDLAESGQQAAIEVPPLDDASVAAPVAARDAEPTPGPAPQSAPVAVPPPSRSRSGRQTAGFVVGAVGVAGFALGAVSGIEAFTTYARARDACNGGTVCPPNTDGPSLHDSAAHWANVSTVAFIAGGALVAGGAVLFFTAPRPSSPAVGVAPAPQGTGLSVTGRF